ncbi:TetR family transcriptional regulator [Pseudoduganella sp. FT26W]|uniref:TetR family transcriptional regulator n=1 Tax=Duganella aquatilis TaxID=2666082 RepID=A0A844D6N5_9BURK|nr:TetR/AcrR family transcriptional regulator [Duganella aquatilis]MRW83180.1 TetR family transcriptional regulator [Duganella aquatilis]
MTTPEPFQRARRPEQKEERRQHLLATAKAALQTDMEVSDLGLNELARRAQMTKSNVYRYFENREALLLALLEEESELWEAVLRARVAAADDSEEQLARAFAGASAAFPLMCRLLSILPSIIERNVSHERLAEFKLRSFDLMGRAAQLLHESAPTRPIEAYVTLLRLAMGMMIGLWPLSHPAPVLSGVLSTPALQPLRYNFEPDFAAGLLLLLRGLKSG